MGTSLSHQEKIRVRNPVSYDNKHISDFIFSLNNSLDTGKEDREGKIALLSAKSKSNTNPSPRPIHQPPIM
jgi:hypothetical protein